MGRHFPPERPGNLQKFQSVIFQRTKLYVTTTAINSNGTHFKYVESSLMFTVARSFVKSIIQYVTFCFNMKSEFNYAGIYGPT
jgi:hypothetical protein